jgi:cell division transport system permease protein
MAEQEIKIAKSRLRSSYVSSIVSISLVLFMVGLLGLVILHAKRISDYVKENFQVTIFLKEGTRDADALAFVKTIDALPYFKSTQFVTKEEAARRLQEKLGEDFVKFLGYNPLLPTVDVHLNAPYANDESLNRIKLELSRNKVVQEVHYEPILIDQINKNIRTIGIVILIFCGLLFVIALALINNTIRLSMYSRRFIIRSMQLVGATRAFIRKPFILQGLLHGLYGSIIAIAMLTGLAYFAQRQIPELFDLEDIKLFGILFGFVLVLGLVISWISTHLAVRKYLKLKLDELYY